MPPAPGDRELDAAAIPLPVLAARLEGIRRTVGAIRYGSRFRVGCAQVVLNPDSPLASANCAGTVAGSPPAAAATIEELPVVWAEAGRNTVVLVDSPSCLPELGSLAEEAGYTAEREDAVLVLRRPDALAEGEPGRLAMPVAETAEWRVPGVLAEAYGWPAGVERRIGIVVGHRLDDPRVAAFGVAADGELVAVALSFVDGGVGWVGELGVRPGYRHRRFGRALASAAVADCLLRGASCVATGAEAGGFGQRFWAGVGFVTAYEEVTYLCRIDAVRDSGLA